MTAAVFSHNITKKFGKPGRTRREWLSLMSAKATMDPGFSYGLETVNALDRASFQVEEGEIFGLLGLHASGKSTLIRLLAALLPPDDGELRIFGNDAVRQPLLVQRWTNRVGMEASFYKGLSAVENLLRGARFSGWNSSHSSEKAQELLFRLGVEPAAMHLPMGEMPLITVQKVTVARALLSRPRLLLLDEPTHDLDESSKIAIKEIILEMRRELNTTVIWATQDFNEVQNLTDRAFYLDKGRIVAFETSEDLTLNIHNETVMNMEQCLERN